MAVLLPRSELLRFSAALRAERHLWPGFSAPSLRHRPAANDGPLPGGERSSTAGEERNDCHIFPEIFGRYGDGVGQ